MCLKQKSCWNDQNIIVDGKFRAMNLLRFTIQCCFFFGIQASIFLTMYYCHLANVNVGIITTIWSIQPMIAGLFDYLIYGEKLNRYHLIGMVFIIVSALCISLASSGRSLQINPTQV